MNLHWEETNKMSYNGLWKLFSRMEFRERDRENIEQNRKWENSRETPQKRRKLNKILKVELKISSKWKKSKSFQSKISLLFSLWGCRFYLRLLSGRQTDDRFLTSRILSVSLIESLNSKRLEYGSFSVVCQDSFHTKWKDMNLSFLFLASTLLKLLNNKTFW